MIVRILKRKWLSLVGSVCLPMLGSTLYAQETPLLREVPSSPTSFIKKHKPTDNTPLVLPQESIPCPTPMTPKVDPKVDPKMDPNQAQPPVVQAPAPDTAFTDVLGGTSTSAEGVAFNGRIDALGRFNLFDNMGAIPQNRIWTTFMIGSGFEPAFRYVGRTTVSPDTFSLLSQRQQYLYRAGAEIRLSDRMSIAAQGVYIASGGTGTKADAWGNPEAMFKYALVNRPTLVLSSTLGVQFQTSTSDNELHEACTRILPGMLGFYGLTDNLFAQSGLQFNFASNGATSTFDSALALGYWLYRDPSLDVSGRSYGVNGDNCCQRRWIRGVISQVEVFSKNALAGTRQNPITLQGSSFDDLFGQGAPVIYREPRNVYDLTVGGRVLIGQATLSLGFGVPLSDAKVRQVEFISGLTFNF